MSRDWDAFRQIWQAEDWDRLQKSLGTLGLLGEFRKFEDEEWANYATAEKWLAMEDILTAFCEMQIRQGDVTIQFVFTPQSINEHYTHRPMELVTGWLQEGAEEFIRAMVYGKEVKIEAG